MREDEMSNIYINDAIDKISRSFHGIFSIDNIPTIKDNDFSIIINVSKQNKKVRILMQY